MYIYVCVCVCVCTLYTQYTLFYWKRVYYPLRIVRLLYRSLGAKIIYPIHPPLLYWRPIFGYEVATISRLLQNIGIFCNISPLL